MWQWQSFIFWRKGKNTLVLHGASLLPLHPTFLPLWPRHFGTSLSRVRNRPLNSARSEALPRREKKEKEGKSPEHSCEFWWLYPSDRQQGRCDSFLRYFFWVFKYFCIFWKNAFVLILGLTLRGTRDTFNLFIDYFLISSSWIFSIKAQSDFCNVIYVGFFHCYYYEIFRWNLTLQWLSAYRLNFFFLMK